MTACTPGENTPPVYVISDAQKQTCYLQAGVKFTNGNEIVPLVDLDQFYQAPFDIRVAPVQ